MVSIVSKHINGKEYLYLVESIRVGNKVTQNCRYIGKKRPVPEEELDCMKYSASGKDWILKSFDEQLSYQDHAAMKKASENYNEYFSELDPISKEKDRAKFLSRFISNSNTIEGSTMTAKETYDYLFEDMIPKGRSKKELFMAHNLLRAWDYMERNSKKMPSEDDLKELHKLVNAGIETDLTLGCYKKTQNYIGDVKTTSHLFVEERMKQLMAWIKNAASKTDDFETAFQSHAQFEVIHPFIDGNGRVGRVLLNWQLLHDGYQPLAIEYNRRSEYISALDNAGKGALKPICTFCYEEYVDQYKTDLPQKEI